MVISRIFPVYIQSDVISTKYSSLYTWHSIRNQERSLITNWVCCFAFPTKHVYSHNPQLVVVRSRASRTIPLVSLISDAFLRPWLKVSFVWLVIGTIGTGNMFLSQHPTLSTLGDESVCAVLSQSGYSTVQKCLKFIACLPSLRCCGVIDSLLWERTHAETPENLIYFLDRVFCSEAMSWDKSQYSCLLVTG